MNCRSPRQVRACQPNWPPCATTNARRGDLRRYVGARQLVVAEPETAALRKWLSTATPQLVACDLVRTELVSAVRRATPERIPLARQVLDTLVLTRVRSDVFEQAGRLDPIDLRSLDAVHLAAAPDLGDDLDAVLTYDDRFTGAALAHGIAVEAPA